MSTHPTTIGERRSPSLLYAVKQVELAIRHHLDELLRPLDVTVSQYTALTVLQRRAGLSSAELARLSFVTAQSMADVVTALERRSLITRTRDAGNRRQLLISLTPEGERLLARCEEPVRALEERMLVALSPGRREDLRRALNACRAALD